MLLYLKSNILKVVCLLLFLILSNCKFKEPIKGHDNFLENRSQVFQLTKLTKMM